MKGELMISDVSVIREKATGRKCLYGGLFDFYGDTKEGLEKLTGAMQEKGLFSFDNQGEYIGIDEKSNRYWTLDDGKPSMDWLIKVVEVIDNLNREGDSLVISISKKFLMENEAVADLTLENINDTKNVEGLIDLYVYYLKKAMEGAGYGNLLKTMVKGKLSPKIASIMENGMIYLDV